MSELGTRLAEIRERFEAAVAQAADEKALKDARVAYLGRSGEVTMLRRGIGQLPPQERPTAGQTINEAFEAMEASLSEKTAVLARGKLDAQ
ncbi:MAG: phenylalanine--tRNA ligase subunit alpha, partial [Candidatus Eremiobacteraeota bacterium]|nr:phenylalanine--tRNA ligase subunit alpha [Candidatus Eremiobacteraeota bacterium]